MINLGALDWRKKHALLRIISIFRW